MYICISVPLALFLPLCTVTTPERLLDPRSEIPNLSFESPNPPPDVWEP